MTADTRPAIDPKTLGRLDALPGSLGKVTLCAVFTLGIAAFVSVRKWMAARAIEDGKNRNSDAAAMYGFRGKSKASGSGGNSNAGGGDSGALGGRTEDEAGAAAGASPSLPQRPQLPPRNYFTIRASLHVKRHNAKMLEWFDEQLGVQLPFSQQLFELQQEERQAPLILLSFRTLREATHRVAVTLEELHDTQTAAAYCEASLSRIADCARVLGTSTTRIGNKEYPAAEYCYLDETQTMVFVFSVFVVHERLAVTLQYVAPTRVRTVMPTAFYDLVRFLIFTAPSPSPSYLLISEPRLGLGYHLPLDFLVHEGLAESDGVEERLFTSVGADYAAGPLFAQDMNGMPLQQQQQQQQPSLTHTRGAGGVASARGYAHVYGSHMNSNVNYGGDWMIPYATAMSRGGRRLGLVTSYEPSIGSSGGFNVLGGGLGSGGLDAATAAASIPLNAGSGGAGGVPYAWRSYLEQQVSKAVRQLGIVMGGGPRVIFQAPDPTDAAAYANSAQALLMEPYPLSIILSGNFSAGDDGREDDSDAVAVTAFSLFREVRIDVNSPYVTLVPDALDAAMSRTAAAPSRSATAVKGGGEAPVTAKAYWSAFYVPVGTACVSFHFLASALRHTSTEFVSFCAAVMNSISLGNHYGQSVSVLYCNVRHDVLPFRLSLPPTGMAVVEEPMLADPLCVVQATYGVEKLAVTVRVFPLFASNASGRISSSNNNPNAVNNSNGGGVAGPRGGTPVASGAKRLSTPTAGPSDGCSPSPAFKLSVPQSQQLRSAERRGSRQRSAMRQLQYMIRYYLTQFPGGVHIVSYTRTTVNSMPAVLLCFRPLWRVDGEDGGARSSTSGGDGAVTSSSAGAGAANNWDDFGVGGGGGGGSSQGASSWADTREAMLEDEVGQLNPFAQYFAPPPPPASYLWGQQPSSSPQPPQQQQATAAAMKKAAEPNRESEDDFFYTRGNGDSQRSQEDFDNPLRVALVVCCEGNAFLFQTSASEYTLGMAQEAVQATATYLALIPRAS